MRRTDSSTVWRRPWRKKAGAHSWRAPDPEKAAGRDKQRQWLEVHPQSSILGMRPPLAS